MRKVVLDVDTGNDDAVAVMLAALHPAIDLVACTTSWGNLDVADTTDNTLRVLDHVGRPDVPVYRGAARRFAPIPFPFEPPGNPHVRRLPIPATKRRAEPCSAAEWLVDTLRATSEKLTIVAVAPLTNIALALTIDPTITENIEELVVMGGGHAFGNITPSAEANFWNDAIAAQVVLAAGIDRVTIIPLDATHQAIITREQSRALEHRGTPAGVAASAIIGSYMDDYDKNWRDETVVAGAPIHDALCVGYLIEPSIVRTISVQVGVETMSPNSWGRSVIDAREYGADSGTTRFAIGANAARFIELLTATFE